MPFSFNGWEIVLLIVLAVVIFGPERLPELARKTARVIHFLRNVANNATRSVREELGPEYAHLHLQDLHPKAMIAKELGSLTEIKNEIDSVAADVRATVADVPPSTTTQPGQTPYDVDAT